MFRSRDQYETFDEKSQLKESSGVLDLSWGHENYNLTTGPKNSKANSRRLGSIRISMPKLSTRFSLVEDPSREKVTPMKSKPGYHRTQFAQAFIDSCRHNTRRRPLALQSHRVGKRQQMNEVARIERQINKHTLS